VLVDTGVTELRPEVADMDPRLQPLSEQAFDIAEIDIVTAPGARAEHEPCRGRV
jgi:N-acyl homoserine lactone hydrolase